MIVFVNEFIFVCFVVVNEYFTMKKCDICFKECKNDNRNEWCSNTQRQNASKYNYK